MKKITKKVVTIYLSILLVGLLVGGIIIGIGAYKTSQIKTINEQRYNEAYKKAQLKAEENKQESDKIQIQLDEIKNKISVLETEISQLQTDQQKEFTNSTGVGFSDKYYAIGEQIKTKQAEVRELESQSSKLQMQQFDYNASDIMNQMITYEKINPAKYQILYFIGGSIIALSLVAAIGVFIFAKRREILAFKVQQVMPVAQEGIEKMAPTIGKAEASIIKEVMPNVKDDVAPAIGEIAKDISKGIKEGLTEKKDKK